MQQNFSQLFPEFPDHSRVWIYQADRQLDGTELAFVKDGLDAFIADWAAHGKGLQARGEVVYGRILILCVNESSVHASGCSIDSSVRFVKALGSELGVDFFDRLHLNAEGHNRVAQALLEKLEYKFDPSWRIPLPPAQPIPWIKKRLISALWFFTFALPWIWRRLRGKSSGDGRVAKYPTPTSWPV